MKEQTLIEQVIDAFRCLPGVGPKSAQRMLLHLLERDREGGRHLARILSEAIEKIGHCKSCRNLTEAELCEICSDGNRGSTIMCVVEAPSDVIAIEQSLSYRGQYFVLMGTLSPIDGRGPDEIGIDHLIRRCGSGIQEIILAVSSTVEGEATAHYIAEALKPLNITISRLAQGIPLGGELEYVDGGTLSHAFEGRKSI
ncbi:MAG: recombination protein RecR [Gammaproteobacteria bacterium]|jgi:recombination protein RecR|nr:recombination protein RecR [Gammaproteobacteria bacterium]MBT5444307.1 recombination protein RecR [Gammaproteobacteria bacterium]MBT5792259.1 recombination protein RecR [Gammaproteobacteria bacterium]MBT6573330.1 recombination protein RecR [Gammaproteobacteria bacterium]MBT6664745.1 recombination protein RecR [Gammaproteobacteria bacterium]